MKNKNILFRADSSSSIGTGHIKRDLVLAQQYKNNNITFASINLDGNINNEIKKENYSLKILNSNSFNELDKIIKKYKIDMIIIDHYDIDINYERKLKTSNPKLKIMVLDDTYNKHHCDILLNHNIYAKKKKYKNKVPRNCKLLCGKKYTLLRDEFYKEKNKYYKPSKKFVIFLAMGGADTANLNIKILKKLKKLKDIKINLLTTKANKNLRALEKYCKDKKYINLHINSNKVAKLMAKSDFAIVTPSVILNEVSFMDLPFVAIQTASNQKEMMRHIKNVI